MGTFEEVNDSWSEWLEKRVCVKDKFIGTLKYFGTTKFSSGLWCGVELDEPLGKNNGTVNNINYFTCLPKYGIFVPVCKVQKIENIPKNLNGPLMHFNRQVKEVRNCLEKTIILSNTNDLSLNSNKENEEINEIKKSETVKNRKDSEESALMHFNRQVKEVQNCLEKTIILSNSDDLPHNSNKENEEMNEIKKSETVRNRRDSEESLGILDMNEIDALSWDSFKLDIAGENVSNFNDHIFKLDNQEPDFSDPLPVSNRLFSNEICNPKYASTPRHPVKSRIAEICTVNDRGLALQHINEHDHVFENILNVTHDVFFDNEKLKNNPNLTSTCEYNQVNNFSRGASVNVFSPIKSNSISPPIDLNEIQVISQPFITDQKIIPVSIDLNKTQTFLKESKELVLDNDVLSRTFKMPTKIDSIDTRDLNSRVCLQIDEASENCQSETPLDTIFETDYIESKNLNSTASLKCEVGFTADTLSKTGFTESKNLNSTINLGSKGESELKENHQKSYVVGTLADTIPCANVNLLPTRDFGMKFNAPAKESLTGVHNKSKTLDNNSLSTKMNGRDNNKSPLEKTFVLDPSPSEEESEIKENGQKSYLIGTLADVVPYANVNLLSTHDFGVKFDAPAKKSPIDMHTKSKSDLNQSDSANISLSKSFNNNPLSTVMNGRDNNKSPLEKTFVLDPSPSEKKLNNEKATPFDYKKKFLEETFIMEKSLSDINSKQSVCIPTKSCGTLNYSKKFSSKIVKNDNSKKSSKSEVSCGDTKSKKGRLSASFNLDEKFNRPTDTTAKTRYSRRFSYSQNSENNELLNTKGSVPLLCKNTESLKISNKIKFSASSKVLSANNLNAFGAPKVPQNGIRKSVFNKETTSKTSKSLAKNVFVSQLKEPTTTCKSHNSRSSLGISSNVVRGIPGRNSLAAVPKKIIPVGIIKPRYSMTPLVEEEKFDQSKNSLHAVGQFTKSNDVLVPESGSKISSSTEFHSSKISKIASSLPQKSQLATRKIGQKLSNVKEENDAGPKIPRYNLRGKK